MYPVRDCRVADEECLVSLSIRQTGFEVTFRVEVSMRCAAPSAMPFAESSRRSGTWMVAGLSAVAAVQCSRVTVNLGSHKSNCQLVQRDNSM
jgi:hypothetical protein